MTITHTVRVPATSANLGPGFDALGLALGLFDVVTASVAGETSVEVTGEGAGELPGDEKHLIVQVMRETFAEIGERADGIRPLQRPSHLGIRLTCVNAIPQARGLGSSSAAIVAGVTLANAMAGGVLSKADELRIAGRIEGHPDNVAPCLLGGFTIAWETDGVARAVSVAPHHQIEPTVWVPGNHGLTSVARAALPAAVPHADASFNAGRSALLVHALTKDPALLFEATEDRLHQGYRAAGMPATAELVRRLRGQNVAATVSGAGPTVLALSAVPNEFEAGDGWVRHTLPAETVGARVSVGNV